MATEQSAPITYIDIYEVQRRPRPLNDTRPPRAQRWRWRAINAGNKRVQAITSESYTNKQDCIDAATQLFGRDGGAILRQPGRDDTILRTAVDQWR